MAGRGTDGGGRGGGRGGGTTGWTPTRNASGRVERDTIKPISLQVITHYDKGHDWQGQGGDDHIKMLKISYADYSKRPARKQVEESKANLQMAEGSNEYNIWYGRYLGEQWKESKELIAAEHRCCVRRDAGKTKAEDRFGEAAYCCLHFARGGCFQGENCSFLHRIPTEADDARLGPMHDCFGRPRHASDRDDMRGTGNFNRMNKTLYIGGLKLLRGPEAAHKSLLRHMSEWGEVEQLRLIPSKAIAFVTFKLRACAEFASEAMHCQTLDADELLNIRWAFDDPNPRAQQIAREKLEKQLIDAMEKKGVDLTDVDYHHPDDYHIDEGGPDAKRQRIEGPAAGAYPVTDAQYAYLAEQQSALDALNNYGGAAPGVMSKEEADKRAEVEAAAAAASRLSSILDAIPAAGPRSYNEKAPVEAPPAGSELFATDLAWEVTADATGATYYFNTVTSETAWQLPSQMAQIAEYARYYNVTLQQARHYMNLPADTAAASSSDPPAPGTCDVAPAAEAPAANGEAKGGQAEGEAGGEDEDFASLMAEAAEKEEEGEGGGEAGAKKGEGEGQGGEEGK